MKSSVFRDLAVTAGVLLLTSAVCAALHLCVTTDTHVPLIFVLAVIVISRSTDGYQYGILASFFAVFEVNYIFTYPYLHLNFTLTGYPLTFAVMLSVSVIVSAMTTQIKQQEQMRIQMDREKMRANLLRSVSHDIRTPLTSIVGSASAILDNYDILSITRISGEGAHITKSDELAEEIVSSAVQKFKRHTPDFPVTVRVPDEVLIVPMDAVLIEQVLINLMDNTVMHSQSATHVTIWVQTNGSRAIFSVEDDGVGFAEKTLPHLFDGTLPFHNSDTGSSRHMQIGLSVCMSIVRAHSGTMAAENLPEGGARIWFELPLEDSQLA